MNWKAIGGRHHQEREDQEHARDRYREGDHEAERQIEQEIPPAHPSSRGPRRLGMEGDGQEPAPQHPVKDPDDRVDGREARDRRPGDPEQAAHQDVLDRLSPARGAIGHQNGGAEATT